jgi:hypothetical protein
MNRFPVLMKRLARVAIVAIAATGAHVAAAQSEPPVDVTIAEVPPTHRVLSLEWNPLALFVDRFSVDLVVVPRDHHALVVSPFYTWASTVPYATGIDANGNQLMNAAGTPYTLNVLSQTFHGFGGELGYRYYFARGGPRGLFLGPSILLGDITATAGNGSQTSFLDYGIAADAGYEALVADRVAVTVGAGVQYTRTSKSIPDQQLPASIYANDDIHPRLLLSLGYAF